MSIPTREDFYKMIEERHGKEMRQKLSAASVAVCGLGGLGSNAAILLARAGVGNLHIIDFDSVDCGNLNRQQYFLGQVGMPKPEALAETLRDINPYCNIRQETARLTEANIPYILRNDSIICEALDDAEQKAALVNCVLEKLPQAYLIAASGMAGLNSANDITTRKITDHFYLCGDECSDISDENALFSTRAALCAAHEAHKILQIIAENF